MSYSRLPLAMAQDGMLPRVFAKVHPKTRVPWVAVLVCAAGWALCLGLGFERLVTLDIMLYGVSLALEFITLIALRLREPQLRREFRVPGGLASCVLVGIFPVALLTFALIHSEHEQVLGVNGLAFGAAIILAGFGVYFATGLYRRPRSHAQVAGAEEPAPADVA